MEGLQELALKDEDTIRQINAIIRDRYFNRMKEIEEFYIASARHTANAKRATENTNTSAKHAKEDDNSYKYIFAYIYIYGFT